MQETINSEPLIIYSVIALLLVPFVSFVILFTSAKRLPRSGDWLATGFMGLNFLISLALFIFLKSNTNSSAVYLLEMDWFHLGSREFTLTFLVNKVSVLMVMVVNFISFLVNLYSMEYMRGKRNYQRYYPYLSIFTFSMMGIVLSHNLLLTFMFWELVGFSSYLLIGFWFDKEAAVKASKKAFLYNRIGDLGFLIALMLIYSHLHTFDLSAIEQYMSGNYNLETLPLWVTLAGLGFFAACVGKSAQFPLQIWLPDAMEGPTPVSALIHAATMVAAGVYLLVKIYFLLTPEVKIFIAFTGATTALIGALPALFQNDIKKVLAYSTISQLGYMVMGMGFDNYYASFFHLLTHAFFKACLFLSAGAIIHAMHEIKHKLFIAGQYLDFDAQDMRWMGGFYKKMPLTFFAYLFSSLALIGIPFFSGALSKELILNNAWVWAQQQAGQGKVFFYIIPILAYGSLLLTTLYMLRQLFMIFAGNCRLAEMDDKVREVWTNIKENHWLINIPLILLGLLSCSLVFALNPIDGSQGWLLQWLEFPATTAHFNPVPLIIIALGFVIAYLLKNKLMLALRFFKLNGHSNTPPYLKAIRNNWSMDSFYYYTLVSGGLKISRVVTAIDQKFLDPFLHLLGVASVVFAHIVAWFDTYIIDGIVNVVVRICRIVGNQLRAFQSGQLQNYLVFVFAVILILLFWVVS